MTQDCIQLLTDQVTRDAAIVAEYTITYNQQAVQVSLNKEDIAKIIKQVLADKDDVKKAVNAISQ